MGATLLSWTDRNAATVIAWNGKLLTVQQDYANLDGAIHHFRLTPKGWMKVWYNHDTQRWNTVGKGGVLVGQRETYFDPHF